MQFLLNAVFLILEYAVMLSRVFYGQHPITASMSNRTHSVLTYLTLLAESAFASKISFRSAYSFIARTKYQGK
jgi:hypothetical protein